jgi:hypothetical protein
MNYMKKQIQEILDMKSLISQIKHRPKHDQETRPGRRKNFRYGKQCQGTTAFEK